MDNAWCEKIDLIIANKIPLRKETTLVQKTTLICRVQGKTWVLNYTKDTENSYSLRQIKEGEIYHRREDSKKVI